MKPRIKHVLAAAAVLATGLSIQDPQADAADTPRPECAEYMPNRVLFGELQTVNCDVSPPQHLDLQMFPHKLDGHTPKYRCDHMGGHYNARRHRCMNIDY